VRSGIVKIIATHTNWKLAGYISALTKCIEWAESIGAKNVRRGRYGHYLRVLQSFQRSGTYKVLNKSGGINANHELLNALREVKELDRVRRYFIEKEPDGLKNKMLEVFDGSLHPMRESMAGGKSSRARNFLAEITLGASFSRSGFEVKYGDDDFPEPLLICDDASYPCQCKRLQKASPGAIQKNIKEASEKLRDNIESKVEWSTGLIVLELTKLINPKGLVLIDIDYSDGQGKTVADVQLDEFSVSHLQPLVTRDPDRYRHVAAIIYRANYMMSRSSEISSFTQYHWINRSRVFQVNDTPGLADLLYGRSMEVPSRGQSAESYEETVGEI